MTSLARGGFSYDGTKRKALQIDDMQGFSIHTNKGDGRNFFTVKQKGVYVCL